MIMRYIFYAVLIYLVYIILKYLLKIIASISRPISTKHPPKPKRNSKFDPDQIEDADYEEIKKP